jgi:hypothetical protein
LSKADWVCKNFPYFPPSDNLIVRNKVLLKPTRESQLKNGLGSHAKGRAHTGGMGIGKKPKT